MIRARTPLDEAARLESLDQLRIVGTPHEEAFDRLARLAANALGAPVSAISFLGSDCEWFKAGHEWTLRELPRDDSIAPHVILGQGPLVVEDLASVHHLPVHALLDDLGMRAYAGHPIRSPSGGNVGVLAVMHRQPRVFTRNELDTLADLARMAEDALALRRAPAPDTERERLAMRFALDSQPSPVAVLDRNGIQRHCNDAWRRHSLAGTPIDPLDRHGRDHPLRLTQVDGPMQDACRAWARSIRDVLSGQQRFVEMDWETHGSSPRTMHATAERVGTGEDTWIIVQHHDRTFQARHQSIDHAALETALARDDLAAEAERRDRALASFLQETSGIETPMTIQEHLLTSGRLGPLPDRQAHAVDAILRGLHRWREAAEGLRRRLRRGDLGDAELASVVEAAVHAARNRALALGIELHATPLQGTFPVRLPADEARRMVDALVDRALAVTPAGGTVQIRIDAEQGCAAFDVEDMGSQRDQSDQIFDPVGLQDEPGRAPLVRVKALAEQAGGWAWAAPAKDGLRLGFTIPLQREETPAEAPPKEEPHQHP